jgi:hypothetical protein
MPSRRRYLASLVAAGSIAGCLGDSGESSMNTGQGTPDSPTTMATTREPQTATRGETVSIDGATLTLGDVVVWDSLFVQASADSKDVITDSDERYLLTTVSIEGDRPIEPSSYSLKADGERVAVGETEFASRNYGYLDSRAYRSDRGGGWLGFTPPAPLDADTVTLDVDGSGWTLSDSTVAQLNEPLAGFDIVAFDYPETVIPDEAFTVSVTVQNTGPVPGRFRGVLNVANITYAYYPYPFTIDLDPGEQGTWRKAFDPDSGLDDPGDTGGLYLRTQSGNRNAEIEAVAASTTET